MTTAGQQGSSTFRRIQVAHEGNSSSIAETLTPGTNRGEEITDGTKYHALVGGALTVTPEVEYMIPEETRASLAERHSVTPTQRQASLSFSGPADFEQIIDFLLMSVKGFSGASAPDTLRVDPTTSSSNARLWTFKPNVAQLNEPSSFSVVYGDNIRNFASAYVMASQISLSGTMGEAVQLSVDMFAQDLTDNQAPETTDKASKWYYQPPYKNTQYMVALRSAFYIGTSLNDVLTGSPKKGYLRSWELTLPTGCRPFHTADADAIAGDDTNNKLDYRTHIEDMRTGELSLSFISQDETWNNEFDAWLNGSGRWVRIVVHGPPIADSGAGTFVDSASGDNDPVLTVSGGTGTGGVVSSYTASGGQITEIVFGSAGSGYVNNDVITLTQAGGSGRTATLTLTSTTAGYLNNGGTASSLTVGTAGSTTVYDRFFDFVAFVRYDDNPEIFADDDGKSLLNFTAHTYDPHQDAGPVSAGGSGWASTDIAISAINGTTENASGTDLVVDASDDNFDFMIRVQNANNTRVGVSETPVYGAD